MKNKFIKIFFIFVLNLSFLQISHSKEFSFNAPEIEVSENGDIYKSLQRGKITTSDQIEINSNNFK